MPSPPYCRSGPPLCARVSVLQAIQALFAACDVDGDGVVTLLEFVKGYRATQSGGASDAAFERASALLCDPINAFIAMDKDSSGSLTLEAPPRSIQALACTRPRSHPALIFTGRAPALMCRSCGPS
jgi:hypothetical protein